MPENTPPTPSTFEILSEAMPKGVASLISRAIDSLGCRLTLDITSEAWLFYESNEELLKELPMQERQKMISEHISLTIDLEI